MYSRFVFFGGCFGHSTDALVHEFEHITIIYTILDEYATFVAAVSASIC
jgi:hypothetical protein